MNCTAFFWGNIYLYVFYSQQQKHQHNSVTKINSDLARNTRGGKICARKHLIHAKALFSEPVFCWFPSRLFKVVSVLCWCLCSEGPWKVLLGGVKVFPTRVKSWKSQITCEGAFFHFISSARYPFCNRILRFSPLPPLVWGLLSSGTLGHAAACGPCLNPYSSWSSGSVYIASLTLQPLVQYIQPLYEERAARLTEDNSSLCAGLCPENEIPSSFLCLLRKLMWRTTSEFCREA